MINNYHHKISIKDYSVSYLKSKPPDCFLYAEDGTLFKTHRGKYFSLFPDSHSLWVRFSVVQSTFFVSTLIQYKVTHFSWIRKHHLSWNITLMFLNPWTALYLDGTAIEKILTPETLKELLGQTKFLRELLKSASCCGTMDIIFPCSKEVLGQMIDFLNNGQFHCDKKINSLKVLKNLNKLMGFPADLVLGLAENFTWENQKRKLSMIYKKH